MSSWTSTSFVDTAVSVSSQGFNAWAVTAGGELYQYEGAWNLAITSSNAPITSVSASSIDGSALAVNSDNEVFQFSYGSWNQLYGVAVSQVSTGDVDNYMLVYTNGLISEFNYGGETPISSGPTKVSGTAGLAEKWGVDENTGIVYRWDGSSWAPVSGKLLKQIHVSYSSFGDVQVVGVDFSGLGWRFVNNAWTTISAIPGNKFTTLEAGAGAIWATSVLGQVYTRSF